MSGTLSNVCVQTLVKWSEVKDAQSCPTLRDHMGYTVHGILQARILERVAFPFSRGSSQPRDQTQVTQITDKFFTAEPQGKIYYFIFQNKLVKSLWYPSLIDEEIEALTNTFSEVTKLVRGTAGIWPPVFWIQSVYYKWLWNVCASLWNVESWNESHV